MPGEIEANAERAAVDAGVVSLPGKTMADLRDLGASVGVDFDRPIAGGVGLMFTVLVTLTVRPERIEEFLRRHPGQRPGVAAGRARLPAVRRPPELVRTRIASSCTRSTPTKPPSTTAHRAAPHYAAVARGRRSDACTRADT